MALIEKRRLVGGRSSYRVRVKYRGRVVTSTHQDRARAERWAAEQGARIRNDHHFAGEGNRQRPFHELIDRYVKHVLPHKRDRRNQERQLAWWKKKLGALPVGKITRALVSQYRDELLVTGSGGAKPCGSATTVRHLAVLSHVFSVAIKDWEWAEVNPVSGVRKPREPRGRVRFLDGEERKRLLEACKQSKSKDLYPFVFLALSTGMRRGEIASLEWRDVDLVRQVITLRETKNGTCRGVPIRGPIVEVLQERAKIKATDARLVFPGKRGGTAIDLTTPWQTAVRRASLRDFRFHDLRHSAASYLAMSGTSLLDIGSILGHKTTQMTKRYAHLSVDHLGSVLERTNARVFSHV
jgi:integrase